MQLLLLYPMQLYAAIKEDAEEELKEDAGDEGGSLMLL